MNAVNTKSKILESVGEKLKKLQKKNKGCSILYKISNVLNGAEENTEMDKLEDFNANEMVYFKYAPQSRLWTLNEVFRNIKAC